MIITEEILRLADAADAALDREELGQLRREISALRCRALDLMDAVS